MTVQNVQSSNTTSIDSKPAILTNDSTSDKNKSLPVDKQRSQIIPSNNSVNISNENNNNISNSNNNKTKLYANSKIVVLTNSGVSVNITTTTTTTTRTTVASNSNNKTTSKSFPLIPTSSKPKSRKEFIAALMHQLGIFPCSSVPENLGMLL